MGGLAEEQTGRNRTSAPGRDKVLLILLSVNDLVQLLVELRELGSLGLVPSVSYIYLPRAARPTIWVFSISCGV